MAFEAFAPYLLRKGVFVDVCETQSFEKFRMVRKREHLLHAELVRFFQAVLYQFFPDALPLIITCNSNGPYLAEVFPQNVKRCDTDDPVIFKTYIKIPDVLIDLIEGTRQHLVFIGELIDERMYRLCVRYQRFFVLKLSRTLFFHFFCRGQSAPLL